MHRSPTETGLKWDDVIRRNTYCAWTGNCIESIMPMRDNIPEYAARGNLESARDIVVDIILKPIHISKCSLSLIEQFLKCSYKKTNSSGGCVEPIHVDTPMIEHERRKRIASYRRSIIDEIARTGLFHGMKQCEVPCDTKYQIL